jgi:hypothetical protein
MPSDLHACRVCGLHQPFLPWGDDGATPSFDICDCCGVEFGYEDATRDGVIRYRGIWIESGAKWHAPRCRPAGWDLESQLRSIPALWREPR